MTRRGLGLRVLVGGPDGTGKSTVLRAFIQQVERPPAGLRLRHVHFDPRRVVSRDALADTVVPRPHDSKPRRIGQLASVVRRGLLYVSATRSGSLRREGADVVVQERGWYDQLVDPRRYRLSIAGARAVRLLGFCGPRYDLVVRLVGDPTAIAARKPELEPHELRRQLVAWQSLASRVGHDGVEIDTTIAGVQDCASTLLDAVVLARSARLEGSMRPIWAYPRRLAAHASADGGAAAKQLYNPATLVGRARRHLAFTSSPRPRGWGGASPRPFEASLAAEVVARLLVPADAMAVIRSRDRERAVVCVRREGVTREFIKVAWGADRASLAAEAAVLQRLCGQVTFAVPPVLDVTEEPDWSALRTGALSAHSVTATSFDPEHVLALVLELASVHDGAGVTHGDFRLWNVLQDDAGLCVLDWEHARPFEVGTDLLDLLESVVAAGRSGRRRLETSGLASCLLVRYAERLGVEASPILAEARRRNIPGVGT